MHVKKYARVQHILFTINALVMYHTTHTAMSTMDDQDDIQYCITLTPLDLQQYVSNNSIASEDQPENLFQSDFSMFTPPNDQPSPPNNLKCVTSHYSQLAYSPAPEWYAHILKNDGVFLPYFFTQEALQALHKQEYSTDLSPELSTWQRFCEQEESSSEDGDTAIELKQNERKQQEGKIIAKKITQKLTLKKKATRNKSRILRHPCMQCSKKFPTPKALTLHVYVHTKEKTNQCPECGDLFNQYCNLKRHADRHVVKQNPDKDLLPYTCAECNRKALQSHTIKQHLKYHHRVPEDEAEHMIVYDDKKKTELNNLTKKLLAKKYVPKDDESQEKDTMYIPKKQNKKYNTPKRSLSCQKPNIIVQCQQTYPTLKRHLCFICREKCTSPGRLQQHIKIIHCTLRPYFCPHCPHSGVEAWVVQRHLKKMHGIQASNDTVKTHYYDPKKAQLLLQQARDFFKQKSSRKN
jgi:hypothetical protein